MCEKHEYDRWTLDANGLYVIENKVQAGVTSQLEPMSEKLEYDRWTLDDNGLYVIEKNSRAEVPPQQKSEARKDQSPALEVFPEKAIELSTKERGFVTIRYLCGHTARIREFTLLSNGASGPIFMPSSGDPIEYVEDFPCPDRMCRHAFRRGRQLVYWYLNTEQHALTHRQPLDLKGIVERVGNFGLTVTHGMVHTQGVGRSLLEGRQYRSSLGEKREVIVYVDEWSNDVKRERSLCIPESPAYKVESAWRNVRRELLARGVLMRIERELERRGVLGRVVMKRKRQDSVVGNEMVIAEWIKGSMWE
jgi:hypothetical protein